jgi:NADPH:quinone reductase-like Zn-dependent oxidoreductase
MQSTNTEYNVLEIQKYGGEIELKKRTLKEKLEDKECLIKIHVTTIHPADMFFLVGAYGNMQPKNFPLVPGFEGSGEIVKVGSKVDASVIGKRVCIVANSITEGDFQGLWGEYTYAPFESLMVFDDKIAYEQIAFSIINPLTVCGFVDTARKAGVKAIIQTAAFGTVGKMLIRMCAKEKDIKTINLVRKAEQVQPLKDIGADYVINTSEKDWQKTLKKLAAENDAKMCFECIGGEIASHILSAMPYGSTLFNYGNLLFKPLEGFNSADLIFFDKRLDGWWLGTWLMRISEEEKGKWFGYVVKELFAGSELFKTEISKSFTLDKFCEAMEFYKNNMSKGKVLLMPKF